MLLHLNLISNEGVKKDQQTNITDEVLTLIGSRIRTLRKKKGWTQEDLAEYAGINDKEVSHIEQGNRNITIETLVKLATSLDIEASSLLSDAD